LTRERGGSELYGGENIGKKKNIRRKIGRTMLTRRRELAWGKERPRLEGKEKLDSPTETPKNTARRGREYEPETGKKIEGGKAKTKKRKRLQKKGAKGSITEENHKRQNVEGRENRPPKNLEPNQGSPKKELS